MDRTRIARLALRRLLANGPLAALPARRSDLELLLELAAARFEPGRAYSEKEVNELLSGWLGTFSAPYGIDHVSLRRCLVDARLVLRDPAGSIYQLASQARPALDLHPDRILAEIREERAARKRRHAA